MKFRTELKNFRGEQVIDYSKKIICIGSCFAKNIHQRLVDLKFQSYLNPCGITYNPISISNSIYHLLDQVPARKDDIFENHGIYSHFDFHSTFSGQSIEAVWQKISDKKKDGSSYLPADILILSLGTAYTYFRNNNGEAVNNCHKLPQERFTKKLLEVDQVVDVLQGAIDEVRKAAPQVRIIVTVSPVRHLRDGMVENNRSKSTLLLAASKLSNVVYFPSYELLLDDLRDYRFYTEDLIHPSPQAVNYILNFFEGQYFDSEEAKLRGEVNGIQSALAHRPFFPNSDAHQKFLRALQTRMEKINNLGSVDFSQELSDLKERLELP